MGTEAKTWIVYGVPGWGSALAETMLAWCDAPYQFVDVTGYDAPSEAQRVLAQANPLAQVPTVITPGGVIMTESAAIAILIDELYPASRLLPERGSSTRAACLRWMMFIASSIYPTFNFSDYPDRWVTEERKLLCERVLEHRKRLWSIVEANLPTGDWCTGDAPTALDLFVTVMTRWKPGRLWFDSHCPRLCRIARQAEQLPSIHGVLRDQFKPPN